MKVLINLNKKAEKHHFKKAKFIAEREQLNK